MAQLKQEQKTPLRWFQEPEEERVKGDKEKKGDKEEKVKLLWGLEAERVSLVYELMGEEIPTERFTKIIEVMNAIDRKRADLVAGLGGVVKVGEATILLVHPMFACKIIGRSM